MAARERGQRVPCSGAHSRGTKLTRPKPRASRFWASPASNVRRVSLWKDAVAAINRSASLKTMLGL